MCQTLRLLFSFERVFWVGDLLSAKGCVLAHYIHRVIGCGMNGYGVVFNFEDRILQSVSVILVVKNQLQSRLEMDPSDPILPSLLCCVQ
jgi:hypothetical protein